MKNLLVIMLLFMSTTVAYSQHAELNGSKMEMFNSNGSRIAWGYAPDNAQSICTANDFVVVVTKDRIYTYDFELSKIAWGYLPDDYSSLSCSGSKFVIFTKDRKYYYDRKISKTGWDYR